MSTIARSDNDWQRHSATRHRHEGECQDRFGHTYRVIKARASEVTHELMYLLSGSGPSNGAVVTQTRLDSDYIRIS